MTSIIFTPPPIHCAIQAEVPVGITDTKTLLLALYNALRFPDYFGMNWDALDECICDLSWLPAGHVNLIHKDMPLLNAANERKIYLSILDDAVRAWETRGSNLIFLCPQNIDPHVDDLIVHRKLFVTFPLEYKAYLAKSESQVQPKF